LATGVPKTRWNHRPGLGLPDAPPGVASDVCLSYDGKLPEAEILAAAPTTCRRLWPHSSPGPHADNRLYYGDNLPILAELLADKLVSGKVRLVYIDPPFATRSVFQSRAQRDAYADLLSGAHYIEFLRRRLVCLRELMAPDASIYVHLDDNMAFAVKVLMDELFGREQFRNCITRKKCNPKNYTRKTYGNVSDYVLFYTKSDSYVWNRPLEDWTVQRALKEYEYVEPGTNRRYKKVPVHAPGVRNGETGQPWRGKNPPPGKHWQFPPRVLDEMDARGEIYWSPNGNPRRKIYLDQTKGVPVQDIWLDCRDAHNQNIQITGYPTEKNLDVLKRIVAASSEPGDLVLDCFSGAGTTLVAAHMLGRRWIGIDDSTEAIASTLRRFAHGTERMGDFVSKPPTAAELDAARCPLFDDDPVDGIPEARHKLRHAVREFEIYAPDAVASHLGDVLRSWESSR
jgi:adenine-specific DNA-methyltransferase